MGGKEDFGKYLFPPVENKIFQCLQVGKLIFFWKFPEGNAKKRRGYFRVRT